MTEERIDIDTDVACRQVTTLEEPQYGYDTTCLDGSEIPVMTADHLSDKWPVNFALLVACFTVSCTGIIAGFDNVVISPIAGLPAFVSRAHDLNNCPQGEQLLMPFQRSSNTKASIRLLKPTH